MAGEREREREREREGARGKQSRLRNEILYASLSLFPLFSSLSRKWNPRKILETGHLTKNRQGFKKFPKDTTITCAQLGQIEPTISAHAHH